MFSIDGAFVSVISELPDKFTENNTKVCQKGHERDFLRENMTSGNFEVAWRTVIKIKDTLMRPCNFWFPGYILQCARNEPLAVSNSYLE